MIKVLLYCFLVTCAVSSNVLYAEEKPSIAEFTMGWYFPSINAQISRTDFHVAINFWLEEFSQSVNIEQTEVKVFDHIEGMQAAFDKGELSVIVAPPLLIAKYFPLNTLADGFIGKSITGKPYDMVVLAREDAQITGVKDVKNKRLALPKNDELAMVFLNSLLIPEFHQTYPRVFKSVQEFPRQNAIIHQLFFKKADVGVAYLETYNLMVELNPQIKDRVKILANFPIDSPNYSFFHYKFPENFRKIFIAQALELNHSPRSQQILNDFRMAALAVCKVESLDPFIDLNKLDQKLQLQIRQ